MESAASNMDDEKASLVPERAKTSSETVRCIIKKGDRILLLQKNKGSMAPEMYEFPGGNIDSISGDESTLEEQVRSVIMEVDEETGLDIRELKIVNVDQFDYEFKGKQEILKRRVHLFLVNLPENSDSNAQTGRIKEDFHKGSDWVTVEQLKDLKRQGKLLGNSQVFEKALI